MSALREAAQQALEALESSRVFVTSREKIKHPEGTEWYDERIAALRAALAQEQAEPAQEQAEPLNLSDRAVQRRLAAQWGYVPAQAEPAQDQRCRAEPRSDGDFVCDCKIGECPGRSAALAQQAEPVEPVAHRAFLERILTAMEGVIDVADRKTDEFDALRSCVIDLTLMLHTTPPQRKPEPVQEPVAWAAVTENGKLYKAASTRESAERKAEQQEAKFGDTWRPLHVVPLYATPPQRKPLTEKEMYAVEEEARKNFRLSQKGPRGQQITYWDSLTPWLIRAVERAHGIKE